MGNSKSTYKSNPCIYKKNKLVQICNEIASAGKFDNEITKKIKDLQKVFSKILKIDVVRAYCLYYNPYSRSIYDMYHDEKLPVKPLIDILKTDHTKTKLTLFHANQNRLRLESVNITLDPDVNQKLTQIYSEIKQLIIEERRLFLDS